MPTPIMSDEELDALFQRGAAAYPDEMPAAAWARMETKLDDAARTQQLRRKVGRFFAGELLLIALLLWQVARLAAPTAAPQASQHPLVAAQQAHRVAAIAPIEVAPHDSFTNSVLRRASSEPTLSFTTAPAPYSSTVSVPSADPRRSLTTSLLPAQPAASATLAASVEANEPALPLATPARIAARAPARAINHHQESISKSRYKKRNSRNNEALVASLIRKKAQRKQSQFLTSADERSTRSQAKPAQAVTSLQADNSETNAANATGPVDLLDGRVASLPVAHYPLPELLRRPVAQQPIADTTQPPRRRAPRPPYRVLVGVLAGPNFSGVRTAETARLGIDYGLTLEYRFSPKLRVRAGLLSSQKHYLAASTDYEAPAAWQWFAGTYDLTANCRITEIPLDLRYDVLQRPTYAVFTSLGFNSLLMRNERYSYDWMANGQTFTKSAEVLKGSNHFLSVLNVSVGFEKPLGQRWSAQVEPFWQIPLGGVGAGKVRLTSAGASFSLKFGLLR